MNVLYYSITFSSGYHHSNRHPRLLLDMTRALLSSNWAVRHVGRCRFVAMFDEQGTVFHASATTVQEPVASMHSGKIIWVLPPCLEVWKPSLAHIIISLKMQIETNGADHATNID